MELERLKFLERVNQISGRKIKDLSECWIWKGAGDKRDGYCKYQSNWAKTNKITGAHNASYKLFKDESYQQSREHPCSHLCEGTGDDYEHRKCVNPNHLYIANSIAENIADRDINRGSYQAIKTSGVKSGSSKLTEADYTTIIKLRSDKQTYKQIAEQFGMNRRTIERICLGRTYKTEYNNITPN